MKAFLCAAGRGTRISKKIPAQSKCTLEVGGIPLIRRTVQMLLRNGIEVVVVVGYRKGDVLEALDGLPVTFVYNPFFDVTNSIGSLWMAREEIKDEDTLIANADVFWSQDILELLMRNPHENILLADPARADDGDFFFYVEDERLIRYGKDLRREERNAEYAGIAFLREPFLPVFRTRLEELIEAQRHDVWWENVLYSLSDERPVYVQDVGDLFWAEVDFIEDYERILAHVRETGV